MHGTISLKSSDIKGSLKIVIVNIAQNNNFFIKSAQLLIEFKEKMMDQT